MKKMNYLVLSLIILGTARVNAQVAIGADSNPHAGAILDLKSTNQGLLLPNVALQNEEILQVGGSVADEDLNAMGMLVYNTNPDISSGVGIYVWDGQRWQPLCPHPEQPGTITLSATVIEVGGSFTASINPVTGATSYIWSKPAGLTITGGQNTTTVTYKTSIDGVVAAGDITVYASNACGNSLETSCTDDVTVTLPYCPGVAFRGGVHTYGGPQYSNISGNITYDQLMTPPSYFTREVSQYLCIYYKDADTRQYWQDAVDNCANGNNVDPADRDGTWRLPNIVELAQMADSAATAPWAPRYNELNKAAGAHKATANLSTDKYWSITEYALYRAMRFRDGWSITDNAKTEDERVRCVKTIIID
ncbi:MAG: DUF1566 domain-containing protein, partial [Candidatus Symbiothrix sp.]|jgi:hypothetical protein|nr:DUF1566 domain-containing protein [Candidatus Symbiothrix sp.]